VSVSSRTATHDLQTRARLLNSGARLFAARGFKNVTVREICAGGDANGAGGNYRVSDKWGLDREVVGNAFSTVRATTDEAVQGAGRPPAALVAAVRREDRGAELQERYGIQVTDAASAAKLASTLVLAVKPQDMGKLLAEIAPAVPPDRLVVSAAAGITTAFIERRLDGEVPVVRVMSNTPVLVDEAMSVISAGSYAGEEHLRLAEDLFRPVGKVLRIPESQQDAATALSGSGPAYVYYLVESMVDAAILLGMARGAALEMVTQAVYGAATMLRDSGEHPVILREAVTSPGGTTISAIRELEKHGVRAAFLAAIEAARDRGRELGGG